MGRGSGRGASAGRPAVSTGPAWAWQPIAANPDSPSAAAKSSASWPGNGSALCRISVALRIAIVPPPAAAVAAGRRIVPLLTAICRRSPVRCPTRRGRLSPRRRAPAPDASRTLDPYGALFGLRVAGPVDRLTRRPSSSTPALHISLRAAIGVAAAQVSLALCPPTPAGRFPAGRGGKRVIACIVKSSSVRPVVPGAAGSPQPVRRSTAG